MSHHQDPQNITHREIYDRVVHLEEMVDHLRENTANVVAAFQAAQGAFVVLDLLTKIAKPLLWLGVAFTATVSLWDHFLKGRQ